jgi:amino acid permease
MLERPIKKSAFSILSDIYGSSIFTPSPASTAMATPAETHDIEASSGTSKGEKTLAHNNEAPGYSEDGVGELEFEEVHAVKQGLHQRHIQMIALAGTIGTGLFLGSGKAIARSGPLGAFLGYSLVGLAVSSVVCAVGEMGALVPLNGGVVRYAEYFFDPALSFANGWNLVYSYIVSIPAESKFAMELSVCSSSQSSVSSYLRQMLILLHSCCRCCLGRILGYR